MVVQAHFELLDDETDETVAYGPLALIRQVETQMLWKLYTPKAGQQTRSDPCKYALPDEPPFLGVYEVSRLSLQTVFRWWTRPRYWEIIQQRLGCTLFLVVNDQLKALPPYTREETTPPFELLENLEEDEALMSPVPGDVEQFNAELPLYLDDPAAYDRSGIRPWLLITCFADREYFIEDYFPQPGEPTLPYDW